jgi:dienelactone hydrolase
MFDFADDPVADTIAAARWLEQDGAETVTLMGVSIGGGSPSPAAPTGSTCSRAS